MSPEVAKSSRKSKTEDGLQSEEDEHGPLGSQVVDDGSTDECSRQVEGIESNTECQGSLQARVCKELGREVGSVKSGRVGDEVVAEPDTGHEEQSPPVCLDDEPPREVLLDGTLGI